MPDLTLLRNNWLLKLLSLIIGASLWYFVVGEDRVDLMVNIPLEIRNLPTDLVIANQYKKEIEVALSGPRRLIQEMRQQNISLPIDLTKAQPGAMVIENEADSIPLPRGITVQRVQPATITLLVDRLLQKEFPIIPVTRGAPADGFLFQGLTPKPQRITVTGPQSVLEKEEAIKTTVIELDGMTATNTVQAHLDLNPALVNLLGETVIEVQVAIKETMVRKTVRGVIINAPADKDLRFTPARVTVEAEIPEPVVKDTPELALLLRATINPPTDPSVREAQVLVHGINLPGHAPIVILDITPNKVRLTP
jgi:YbbR domain-containing protein